MTKSHFTIEGQSFTYVSINTIRCGGIIDDGDVCGKLLGKNLYGQIEIKCPRCGYMATYHGKQLTVSQREFTT